MKRPDPHEVVRNSGGILVDRTCFVHSFHAARTPYIQLGDRSKKAGEIFQKQSGALEASKMTYVSRSCFG